MISQNEKLLLEDKIIMKYQEGYSVPNISKILNCKEAFVYGFLKRSGLKLNPMYGHLKLTQEQKEILIGTVLGDAYITKKNALKIVHSEKQETYFNFKFQKFRNLFIEPRKYVYFDKRFNKTYTTIYSRSHPIEELKIIRDIFYVNDIKIIPMDYLYENFTEKSLAFLFMDDGEVRGRIALMCFSDSELQDFCTLLYKKFNIVAEINKERCVCIREISRTYFEELIKPHMCESMYYKLKNIK